MIKAVQLACHAQNAKEFSALVEVLDALGLERGEGWEEKRSRGVVFLAPQGQVKVAQGEDFGDAHVGLEVSDVDALYALARRKKLRLAGKIEDTDWGARWFAVETGGIRIAIFSRPGKSAVAGLAGKLDARGQRFGIVMSRFNSFITERLLAGALDALHRTGARDRDIEIARVPGAFEIPAAARAMAETRRFDAVICLGCILRGETSHYEHLANEVTRGIGQAAQETGVPHAYGLLTCDTLEQAIDRAGLKSGNKGFEAGLSAVEMASLKKAVGRLESAAKKPAKQRAKRKR
ncbi:MAG TPA: 6,7-dimethyl-8-ribityllumazine synthase [Terriglobales bacterium]|nr:6,7-dimethyl-8-ribityllumazine synthase [Terriglobales bacterium]